MILGRLRTKKRKDKVSVDYLIHVKQISPWHLAHTQNPEEPVLLQWEGGNKSFGSLTSGYGDEKIEFNESFKLPITLTKESSRRSVTSDGFQRNCLEFHLYESHRDKGLRHLGSASINLADYGVIEDKVAISAPVQVKKTTTTRSASQPFLYVSVQSYDKDSTGSSPKGKQDDDDSIYNDDDSVYNDDDNASVHSARTSSFNSEATTHSNEKFLDEPTRTEPVKDIKETAHVEPDLPSRPAPALPISGENTADPNHSEVRSRTEPEKDSKKTVNMESATPRIASHDSLDSPDQFYDTVNSEFLHRTKSAKDMEPDISSGGASANSEKKSMAKSIKHLSNISLKSIAESVKERAKMVNMEHAVSSGAAAFASSDKNPVADSSKQQNKSITESGKDRTTMVNMEPAVSSGAAFASSDKNPMPDSSKHQNKSTTESGNDRTKTVNVEPAVSSGAAFANSESFKHQNESTTESAKDSTKTVNVEPAANSDKHLVAESVKHLNQITEQSTTESSKDMTNTVNVEPAVSSGGAAFASSDKNPVAESIKHLNKITTENTPESAKDRTKTMNTEPTVSSANPVAESFKDQNKSKAHSKTESAKESIEVSNTEPASNESSVTEPLKSQSKSKVLKWAESVRDNTDTIHVEHAPCSGAAVSDAEKVSVAVPSENQNNSSIPKSTVDMTSFRKIVERRKKASDGSAIVRKAAQQSRRASSFTSADLGMNSDSVSFSESQIVQEDDTKAGRQSKDSTSSSLSIDVPENKIKIELQKNQENEVKENFPENKQLPEHPRPARKEFGSWAKARSSTRNADQGSFVPNDNLKHVKPRNLSFNSAKSNGPSRNKELRVRSIENDVPEDTRTGSKSPTITETKGTKNEFSDSKDGLKSENEMLKEELREAAAIEVALYSVVAEHGNSANKVHAPARRLSRFYFHACKEGSRSKMAGAARTSISGLILVSRACGNDVPRLTFWLSNSIVLRATVCQASGNLLSSAESNIVLRKHKSFHEKEKNNSMECFEDWENIHTFIAALEKVEGWIFSRIVESVWWQTLTPYMQSDVAKNSSPTKSNGKKHAFGDPDHVNFSIDLWKKAFNEACERLCPLRAAGLQCGCLTVLARLVMEQLVNRLDVAMFNAILRDSDEEMPTDPLSDPISDPHVLPVPAGKTSFGAGVQLKNSIGNWSRWLTDLFGIDDDPSVDNSEPYVVYPPAYKTSFKPFYLLKSLSDFLMIPFDCLADGSTRQEVCPSFGAQFIKKVLTNFVPDEFCPDRVPESVFDVLDAEVFLEVGKDYITGVPCNAAPLVYSLPKAAALKCIIGEFGSHSPSHAKGVSLLKKAYASDDELDELDSPIKSISIDSIRVNPCSPTPKSKGKAHQKAVRYQLLREVWDDED